MCTIQIITGLQGTGKTTLLKNRVKNVGGKLMSISEIRNFQLDEFGYGDFDTIGVDEVYDENDFKLLDRFGAEQIIITTQRSIKEILSFGLTGPLMFIGSKYA